MKRILSVIMLLSSTVIIGCAQKTVGPDVALAVALAVGPDVGPDVGSDVGSDVAPDVAPALAPAVGPDVAPDDHVFPENYSKPEGAPAAPSGMGVKKVH